MSVLPLAIVVLGLYVDSIAGHGRMLVPAGRSSLWRTNDAAPKNYNDDQTNCGGKGVQINQYGGKCGVCGDPYGAAHPQENENGGKFGRGIIAATYRSGQVVDVQIELTANHMGTFNYSVCVLNGPNAVESESCFQPLKMGDGSAFYTLPNKEEDHSTVEWYNKVKLPDGLRCDRCVFRWWYRVANGWGLCGNGQQGAVGCGDQETFVACSDIKIT